MPYIRKTRDYWDIEQNCGYGWEVVNAEDTWKDARRSLKEYRENQPEYPVRARRKRERIELAEAGLALLRSRLRDGVEG